MRRRSRTLGLLLGGCAVLAATVPGMPAAHGQSDEEAVKTIRGVVLDLRGEPVPEARVFVRDLQSNITRTLSTDASGLYAVHGLPPDADYELRVEYQGTESETRLVSAFFERRDNVLNFELPVAAVATGSGLGEGGIALVTFDRVQLRAEFTLPEGIPAPIPTALLLHGYGEDRSVWADLESRLLSEGWAVMTLDLRGHGSSTIRNNEPIGPVEAWRSDPQQFPLDLDPAMDWLKTQPRLDSTRLAVIGSGLGANLALVASGRYPEVATTVAINPDVTEAQSLAGAGQEFNPSMVQIIVSNGLVGLAVRESVSGGSRLTLAADAEGGTPVWLATDDTLDEIVRWLRDTY